MAEILAPAFAACLVLTAIHVYLGIHVLARGVIFVDLALAQVAALGLTVAILAGHAPASEGAYWYALAFALAGAATFAATRQREERVPQEAIIGIVYAVSTALAVLVVDRAPQGAEHIKQLLVGSILSATFADVAVLAALYAAIGVALWATRGPMLAISFDPAGARRRGVLAWDLAFYGLFAVVVTSSVRIAGVLLVFSFLVVPAATAALFVRDIRARLVLGWAVGALVSAIGLAASWGWDLPTGAAIVAAFGAAILAVVVALGLRRGMRAARRNWHRASLSVMVVAGIVVAAAGALLAAFPRMDHLWLDALERFAPAVQEAFLTPAERDARDDAIESVRRGGYELARLRAMQEEVRWGARAMSEEKQERMRQYIAGRSEIVAGDRLSLGELRSAARERQRFAVGLPMLASGLALGALAIRALRSSSAG